MDINTFFNNNSTITTFINNLAALLDITDTSMIKVVGVFSGSVIVTAEITPSSANSTTDATLPTISALLTSAINSGSFSSSMAVVGTVIGASSTYYTLGTTTSSSSGLSLGFIVGISIAGVALLVGVFVTVVCCLRRRAKVVEEIVSHEDEPVHEKSVDKENNHFIYSDSADVPN